MDLRGQLPRGCQNQGADAGGVAGGHPPVSGDQEAQSLARAGPPEALGLGNSGLFRPWSFDDSMLLAQFYFIYKIDKIYNGLNIYIYIYVFIYLY